MQLVVCSNSTPPFSYLLRMQGEASWPSCSSLGTRLNDPVSEVDVMKYEQAFLAPLPGKT